MCKVLKVSHSGYYAWSTRKPSKLSTDRQVLCKGVEDIYYKSKGRYGSPKIVAELRSMGLHASRPRVARIMKDKGFRSIITGKFKVCTTDSSHKLDVSANILNREFTATAPSEKWVSDLTYIRTNNGWLYLTVIMDLFDRRIVGWSMSTGMTARETTVAAWNMAIRNRSVSPNMVFHSDRGGTVCQ